MEYLRRRLSDGNFLAGGVGVGGGAGGDPPPGVGRSPRTSPTAAKAPPLLLVIAPPGTDWVKLFKGKSVHGDVELRVEQAQFSELSLVASTHGALSVAIHPPQGDSRRFRPDFVLVREAPGGGPEGAARRLLAGLQLGGVPCSDPIPALYGFSHPPCLFAELVKLQRELGPEAFPLIPQRFCNRPRGLLSSASFPLAVRLSPSPAGVGQARVGSPQALGAVAAAMGGAKAGALLQELPTGGQRLRLQRIGAASRGLWWPPVAADPPGDPPGEAEPEPLALSPRHRDWLDACARLFGGVDICGVEALRAPDGSERIVEVLGSWLPLVGPGAAEDQQRIMELVLSRMRAELPRPSQAQPRSRPQQASTVSSGSPRQGTPPQQRPTPQGAPQPPGPAQPRPAAGGGVPPGPTQPRGPTPPRPQVPPASAQPRPQASPASPQLRPQAQPFGGQPRPQTPPPATQPRPQVLPAGSQPRPQTPPTSPQPRPQAPPTAAQQPRPQGPSTSPQLHPQTPSFGGQPRPQTPPSAAQPRPQAQPPSPQPRPQAQPPSPQPRPQAQPPSPQPRPQAQPPSPQPRPQSPQPRFPAPLASGQPRPQAPPTSPQARRPGAQAPPTTRQPRPQAPPIAPKPILAPKLGGAPPPSPAPEQAGAEGIRSLRQSFANLFAD